MTQSASADWIWQPLFQAGFEYNDNFNLTPDPLEVWRSYFSGRLLSNYRQEQWRVNFDGTYRGSRYIDHDEIDQDEGFVNLFGDYSGEYNSWELDVNMRRDQPASSQLQAGTQTFNRINRFVWSVAPAWNWTLDPRSHLRVGYGYSNTSYSQEPTIRTSLSDYFTHTGSVYLSHQLYEATQLFSQWNLIHTVNDSLGFISDQYSLALGVRHSFSESTEVTLSGGGLILVTELQTFRLAFDPVTSTIQILPDTRESTLSGYIFSVSVSSGFENTDLYASFDRNLSPTVNGGQVELYSLRFNAKHRLTEQLSAHLDVYGSKSSLVQGTVSQTGQLILNAKASLRWRFGQHWNLDCGYLYGRREIDNSNRPANRNSVFVSLNYEWDPQRVLH